MISVKAQGCTSSHAHVPRHCAHFTRMRSDSQASNNPTHAAYATLVAFSPQHGPGQLPALAPRVTRPPSRRRSPPVCHHPGEARPARIDLRASAEPSSSECPFGGTLFNSAHSCAVVEVARGAATTPLDRPRTATFCSVHRLEMRVSASPSTMP